MPMARPDDEDKPFVVRWNAMMRVLLVDSSVKLVGRTAMDYADIYKGTSCRPSNARLGRECIYTRQTVQPAWGILRGLGFVEVVEEAVASRRRAAEYKLQIPDDWATLPILGPHSQDFRCLNCGDEFAPQPKVTLNELKTDKPGTFTVRWDVKYLCFCPPPRAKKGRAGSWCFDQWQAERKKAGKPTWSEVGASGGVWGLFREARADDW